MRAAAELLYLWDARLAGEDDSDSLPSHKSVERMCDEIQREGAAAVTAVFTGFMVISQLALTELGFHETLDAIMLRAEIDARRETDDVACP